MVSVSIGVEYADFELPYYDVSTGKTESMRIGNFIDMIVSFGILRDGQAVHIFFPELLHKLITPGDRAYKKNLDTLMGFLKTVQMEKLD